MGIQTTGIPFFCAGDPNTELAGLSPENGNITVDVATFQMYFFYAGTWNALNAASAANATKLQGIAVSATPPTDGQVLKYVNADLQWEPAADT